VAAAGGAGANALRELGRYFFRSLRVSNRRFKEAAGWSPDVPSVLEGWPRIAAGWRAHTHAVAAID